MEQLPIIIPTPSGYEFARLIEKHLRENYLPKRGITARPGELWATTDVTTFADTDCMVDIKEHIRDADVYIICDVQSGATPLPRFRRSRPNSLSVGRWNWNEAGTGATDTCRSITARPS